jgi:hypothetical protein
MKKYLALLGALLIAAPVVWAQVGPWDGVGGFEETPDDADSAGEGAERIRELKTEARYRGEVEHNWGTTNTPDNGLHREGSGRCFYAATAPTVLAANDYDPVGGGSLSGADDLNAAGTGAGDIERGEGRCWIDNNGPLDTDAGALALEVWDVAGDTFEPAFARSLSGSHNLLYNGGFDHSCAEVAAPQGWTLTNATATTGATDTSEGTGCEVRVTDGGAGNGYLQQAVVDLKQGAPYRVTARVKDDGGDVCMLDVNGEANADFVAVSTTTDLYETLTGTFIADAAALDDVNIRLITVGVGLLCDWDFVALYEETGVPPSERIILFDSEATNDTIAAAWEDVGNAPNDIDDLAVTIPSHGYKVEVLAILNGENQTGLVVYVEARVTEDCGGGAVTVAQGSQGVNASGVNDAGFNIALNYVNEAPVPGTTCTYAFQMQMDNADASTANLIGISSFMVKAVPEG